MPWVEQLCWVKVSVLLVMTWDMFSVVETTTQVFCPGAYIRWIVPDLWGRDNMKPHWMSTYPLWRCRIDHSLLKNNWRTHWHHQEQPEAVGWCWRWRLWWFGDLSCSWRGCFQWWWQQWWRKLKEQPTRTQIGGWWIRWGCYYHRRQ